MGVCYIVGAGDFHGSFTPAKDDLVIAADGGYLALMERGIRCDILLGDMDSLSELGVASSDCKAPEILKFPVEKDETDTHLAYLEGERRGYTKFYIYGGTGGREDHTFANYSLPLYGKNAGHRITLVGKDRDFFVIKNESVTLSEAPGKDLSVFAFGGDCAGVSIAGAKYEAADVSLSPAFPLGVSNSFVGTDVTLTVKRGALLIMVEK